jgi:putative membrane protein
MTVWWLIGLLVLAVGLVGTGYLLSRLVRDSEHREDAGEAMAILRRRYASGEIDDEEFERRASRLRAESADVDPNRTR